jgi:hypothetical protein
MDKNGKVQSYCEMESLQDLYLEESFLLDLRIA